MVNANFASSGAQRLSTTITSASLLWKKGKKEYEFLGFDAGTDIKGLSSFGSIASGSYTDGLGTGRIIRAFYENDHGGTNPQSWWICISTTPGDADTTFTKLILDGNELQRADADATGTVSTIRWWRWDSPGPADSMTFAGANPDDFELWST